MAALLLAGCGGGGLTANDRQVCGDIFDTASAVSAGADPMSATVPGAGQASEDVADTADGADSADVQDAGNKVADALSDMDAAEGDSGALVAATGRASRAVKDLNAACGNT